MIFFLAIYLSTPIYGKEIPSFPPLAKKAENSIVRIAINSNVFSKNIERSAGTGFVISPTSIVTNLHVIARLSSKDSEISIRTKEGAFVKFKRIKRISALHDLAELEVEVVNAPGLTFGSLSSDEVYAFGHPKEGKSWQIRGESIKRFDTNYNFQINCYTPKGASGGPVLNNEGKVVGILHSATQYSASATLVKYLSELLQQPPLPLRNSEDLIREAYDNLKKSAEQGNANAQYVLGLHLAMKGKETEIESIKWYDKAAKQGHIEAQSQLQMLLLIYKDFAVIFDDPFQYLLKAAEQGNANAQVVLGNTLHEGKELNPRNTTAFTWYLKAAEQGNASALFALGQMYREGKGVYQSQKVAFEYFLEAAEKGHKKAQFNVAQKFRKEIEAIEVSNRLLGREANQFTVEQELEIATKSIEALTWYLKAVEQGYSPAMENMKILLREPKTKLALQKEESLAKRITKRILLVEALEKPPIEQFEIGKKFLKGDEDVEQSDETAFALFQAAAEAGLAEAQHEAGYMLIHGKGVDQSEFLGFIWLSRAEKQGFVPSRHLIDDLKEKESRFKKIHERAWEFLTSELRQTIPGMEPASLEDLCQVIWQTE